MDAARRVSAIVGLIVLAMFCVLPDARAQSSKPILYGGDNLIGHRGLLRIIAATNHEPGYIGLGTSLEFFSSNGFLALDSGAKADHTRLVNSYSIAWAPLRYLEVAFAMHVVSDSSEGPDSSELQVAVGDPELSLKGSYELDSGFAFGGLLDFRFPSAAGFFEFSGGSIKFLAAALASWSPKNLPIALHVNLGFLLDNSDNLFDDPSLLTEAQRFSAQISSFNRIVIRAGAEYSWRYVGPFLELDMEPYVGSGAPGFGDSPTRLSMGLRGWIGKTRAVQLLAAVDIGLTGVGGGEPIELDPGDFAVSIPRWNLAFRISYRFDPFAPPEVKVVTADGEPVSTQPAAVETTVVTGTVLERGTDKPVWNARIKLADGTLGEASALAVEPTSGRFRTFGIPLGKQTLIASAEGFEDERIELDVGLDANDVTINLVRKTRMEPGTIRGIVSARGGGATAKAATVLIPALDKRLRVDSAGNFSVKIKPGQYGVVISAPGYRTQRKKIRVFEGSTVILNVELYK